MAKRRKPLSGSPVSLIARLWRTAERQVRDIEDRLRLNQQPADERERDARMLAVIVKTVRDLRALRDCDERAGRECQETSSRTSTISAGTLREKLTLLSPAEVMHVLAMYRRNGLDCFEASFDLFSHVHREPPAVAQGGEPWTTWLILGGRGAGKTRAGAEFVRAARALRRACAYRARRRDRA